MHNSSSSQQKDTVLSAPKSARNIICFPLNRLLLLYSLFAIFGCAGLALSVRLESEPSSDSTKVSERVLYGFFLFLAGAFLEILRLPDTSNLLKQQAASTVDAELVTEIKTLVDDFDAEADKLPESKPALNNEVELTVFSVHAADSPRASVNDIKSVAGAISSKVEQKQASILDYLPERQPPWLWCCITFRDCIPSILFLQSLSLVVRNAQEESTSTSLILPYTALASLFSGFLFHVSLHPFQWGGIRNWIQYYRNYLTLPEYALYGFSLVLTSSPGIFTLLSATIAPFWTGYNAHELITKMRSSKQDKNILSTERGYRRQRTTLTLIAAGGAAATTVSLVLIQLPIEDLTLALLRNYISLWLAGVGTYALTYPLGNYLGRYVPHRYREKALVAAIYLLVPFANPGLTIPHFLLMLGAGLCGGLASTILRDHERIQYEHIQTCWALLQPLRSQAPDFCQLLNDLPLLEDRFLQFSLYRKKKIKFVIKATFIGSILLSMGIIFTFIFGDVSQTVKICGIGSELIDITGFLISYLMMFRWLPQSLPSPYTSTPLVGLERIAYQDSFTQVFLIKISVILLMNWQLLFQTLDPDKAYQVELLNEAMFSSVLLPITAKIIFKGLQGYSPYVPSRKEIHQLLYELAPNTLQRRLVAKDTTPIRCSHHLLKFIQQNLKEKAPQLLPEQSLNSESKPAIVSGLSSPRFWRRVTLHAATPNETRSISPVAVAELGDSLNLEPSIALEAVFDIPHDKTYVENRCDVTFEFEAIDAALRGSMFARNVINFPLPQSLSLSPYVRNFQL